MTNLSLVRIATPAAVRSVVAVPVRLASQALGGHRKVPDVAIPPSTFVDVMMHHSEYPASASRTRGTRDASGCPSVLHALYLEDEGKFRHYEHERALQVWWSSGSGYYGDPRPGLSIS